MRLTEAFSDTPFGIWVLRVLLGSVFLITGLANVFGWITTENTFAIVGLPDAVRVIIGVAEIAAALLLFVPGLALPGASILGVCLLILFVARATHGHLPMAILTAFWLVLTALVARGAWLERPWRPDDPFDPELPARRTRVRA